MAGARVFWTPVPTNYPEGTSPADHYVAHLGTMVSPNVPLTMAEHVFIDVAPGDYPSSVDTVAADGTVLAMHTGPVFHMPTPVVVPVAMNVGVDLVP
jgi:hypothetical protein